MNIEFCKQAMAKVGDPNLLINLVSRRVRQLNAGGGGMGRPLIDDYVRMGTADIALKELVDEKIGWEKTEEVPALEAAPRRRRRRQ